MALLPGLIIAISGMGTGAAFLAPSDNEDFLHPGKAALVSVLFKDGEESLRNVMVRDPGVTPPSRRVFKEVANPGQHIIIDLGTEAIVQNMRIYTMDTSRSLCQR